MSIIIKSAREIEVMKEAGKILEKVHEIIKNSLRVGMTTMEIDQVGEKAIRSFNCEPSFLNYHGYPASVCVSINDEVVHGIPTTERKLKDGDVVGLDVGVKHQGFHSDAARTYIVGNGTKEAEDLIRVTEECFFEGIKFAKAGNYLNEISTAIDNHATKHGYGIVRDLCGHGIGANLHEGPEISNFSKPNKGPKLRPGMTLAIEPMINAGTHEVWWLEDDWTVVSRDGSISAHYENTVLITEDEPIILTLSNKR